MDQVKVDIIPAQSLEGIIQTLLIGFESQFSIGPDFGDDGDGIFFGTQGFAQSAFRFSIAIAFSSIESGDAVVEGGMHDSFGVFWGTDISPSSAGGDLPASQGDLAPILVDSIYPAMVHATHLK
jgi:hypothetical protein